MLWPGIVDAGQLVVPRPNEQYGQAIYMSEQQPFQGEENFVTPAQQAWTTPPFRPVQQGMGGWPVGGLPAAGEPTAHPAMTPPKRKLPEDPDLLSPLRTKRLRTTEPWRPEDPVCNELSSFPASPARAHKRKADPLTPGDGLVGKRTRGLDFLPQDYVQRDARKKRHYSDMEAPDEVYQGLARLQLAPCRQVPTTHVLINKRQRRAHGDDPSSSEDEDDGVERFVVIDRQRLNDPLSDVIRDMQQRERGQMTLYRSPESYIRDILRKAECLESDAEVASQVISADRPFIIELPDGTELYRNFSTEPSSGHDAVPGVPDMMVVDDPDDI